MKRWVIGVLLLLTLTLGAMPALADLVTNGSFEFGTYTPASPDFNTLPGGSSAITGWTVTGGSVDWIGHYWNASDGNKSLDLNGLFAQGGVQLSTALNTIFGQVYKVSFDLSGNFDGGPNPKTLTVFVAGAPHTFTFDSSTVSGGWSHGNMGWQTDSFTFTATGPSTTLSFLGDPTFLPSGQPTAFGPALDNVRVNAVPLPPTALLLGSGLLGLVGLAWRRRKEH